MNNSRKRAFVPRRTWNQVETRILLRFCIDRKAEFNHIYKKKFVYKNLAEELNAAVSGIPFTVKEIKSKIKSLKQSYKEAIDNKTTNSSYAMGIYKDLLDDLFNTEQPYKLSDSTTISVGSEENGNHIKSEERVENFKITILNEATCADSEPTPSDSVPSLKINKLLKTPDIAKQKMDFLREQAALRAKRHEEKEAAKERRHAELMNYLKSL